MSDKPNDKKRSLVLHAVALAFFIAVHLLIFSDLVLSLPSLITGNTVITREELIPVFDLKTQYLDQLNGQASALTMTDEIRIAYSFWTSWLRWYPALPFALILLNAASAWILYYAFYSFARDFFRGRSIFLIFASVLAALFIHLVLLYSKITHFYTLIFGFSLFALSISLTLRQILFKRLKPLPYLLFTAATVLLNPAIHYHVLYYLVAGFFFASFSVTTFILKIPSALSILRKNAAALSIITIFSVIPYAALIWFVTSHMSASIGDSVPINYDIIFYASSNLSHVLSLTIPGHVDLYRSGFYSPETPRIFGGVVMLLALSPLLFFRLAYVPLRQSASYLLLSSATALSIWLSLGYAESYSFHSTMSSMLSILDSLNGTLSDAAASVAHLVVQVLRYPHRFTFILLYTTGLMSVIAPVWWYEKYLKKGGHRLVAYAAIVFLFLFPFASSSDYRATLFSGDFGGFLAPYGIPNDLKTIKAILAEAPEETMFILPSLESGREMVNGDNRFRFIDKFLIYYLNHPTYYYGTGAQTQNKIVSFIAYRSISYDDDSWQSILIDNLGVRFLLYPHAHPREKGFAYLPEIDSKISRALSASSRFELVYDGDDYSLYKTKTPSEVGSLTYINLGWLGTLTFLSDRGGAEKAYKLPVQTKSFLNLAGKTASTTIITDNIERAFYDLYAEKTGIFSIASTKRAPFSRNIALGSMYTVNAYSQFNLYSANNPYNVFDEALPGLVNSLTGQFARFIDSPATIEFSVAEPGEYRLLMRGASTGAELEASVNGQKIVLQKTSAATTSIDMIEFDYFTADIALTAGQHTFRIIDTNEKPIVLEFLSFIPLASLPDFDSQTIVTEWFDIARKEEGWYDFTLK